MWMAGNTISIFPIMMVGMMFIRPIQALLALQQSESVFGTAMYRFYMYNLLLEYSQYMQ